MEEKEIMITDFHSQEDYFSNWNRLHMNEIEEYVLKEQIYLPYLLKHKIRYVSHPNTFILQFCKYRFSHEIEKGIHIIYVEHYRADPSDTY